MTRPWARAPSWSRPAAPWRASGRCLGALARNAAQHPRRRGRGTSCAASGRATLPLWRRQEPARRRSRAAVALARDTGEGPRIHVPRSRAEMRRQPRRTDVRADRGGELGRVKTRPATFRQLVKDRVAEALKARAEIQSAPDDTMRATQEARHRALEGRLTPIRSMGDAVISAFFAADKPKAREKKRAEVESWLSGLARAIGKLDAAAASLRHGEHTILPFHWEIEFPEVFPREWWL